MVKSARPEPDGEQRRWHGGGHWQRGRWRADGTSAGPGPGSAGDRGAGRADGPGADQMWPAGGPPDGRGAGQPWPGRRRPHGRWRHGPRIPGPLRRRREDGLAGGVAAGIAAKTGFDVTVVRTAFVVAALAGGFGLAAYIVGWLLVPAAGDDGNIASKAMTDRRGIAIALGVASILLVIVIVAAVVGLSWLSSPLVISGAGLVLIWRNAPEPEQAVLRRLADPLLGLAGGGRRSWLLLRCGVAAVLLVAGLSVLGAGRPRLALLRPLGGLILVIAAIVLLLGPWWLRLVRDLMAERRARVRAEERAEFAARVHDSVLQTLALIQRRADEPQRVVALARAQERELRSWLFDGRQPGSLDEQDMTLADGIRLLQQEVEARHEIAVEAVTVGDCELDDDLRALLAAAREATVNAAKWSGAPVVSLFAEVEPSEVSVFVRDRGCGFDPAAVPADRKGLTESVQARMARRGGTATIKTTAGEGTEVRLSLRRGAGQRQASRA